MGAWPEYNVQVQGVDIDEPREIAVDMPSWFGDKVIAAQRVDEPDAVQRTLLMFLADEVTARYRIAINNPDIEVSPDQMIVREPITKM